MCAKSDDGISGQATIEFALMMILFFSFFLFYFQLALALAYGNYVHYATFMSARAYLSAGSDRGDQVSRSREVIQQMVKKSAGSSADLFGFMGKPVGGDGDISGYSIVNDSSGTTGVRYSFKSKLFLIPMGGTGAGANSVTLTSDSMLGREPSESECMADIAGKLLTSVLDNGC